jgi:hypothetical protein
MPWRCPDLRYCDFSCPKAEFPPAETAGICRTMAAVYCKALGRLAGKNTPCAIETQSVDKQKGRKAGKKQKRPGTNG